MLKYVSSSGVGNRLARDNDILVRIALSCISLALLSVCTSLFAWVGSAAGASQKALSAASQAFRHLLDKETLRFTGANFHRKRLQIDSANSERKLRSFCGISLRFDLCDGQSLRLPFAILARSVLDPFLVSFSPFGVFLD